MRNGTFVNVHIHEGLKVEVKKFSNSSSIHSVTLVRTYYFEYLDSIWNDITTLIHLLILEVFVNFILYISSHKIKDFVVNGLFKLFGYSFALLFKLCKQ